MKPKSFKMKPYGITPNADLTIPEYQQANGFMYKSSAAEKARIWRNARKAERRRSSKDIEKQISSIDPKIAEAAVILIIKDGLILGMKRSFNSNQFGLIGGRKDTEDFSLKETAIREAKEESGLTIKDCIEIYSQLEPAKESGIAHQCSCFYAIEYEGEIISSDEGEIVWLTQSQLIDPLHSRYSKYNIAAIAALKKLFPNILLND